MKIIIFCSLLHIMAATTTYAECESGPPSVLDSTSSELIKVAAILSPRSQLDREQFDRLTQSWSCDFSSEKMKIEMTNLQNKYPEIKSAAEIQKIKDHLLTPEGLSQLRKDCVTAFRDLTWRGLTSLLKINPELVLQTLGMDFGGLKITDDFDCGRVAMASACFEPNLIFNGGKLRFRTADLLILLAPVYPVFYKLGTRGKCNSPSDRNSNSLCELSLSLFIDPIENAAFHEITHYLKFDNQSLRDHIPKGGETYSNDVVYSCAQYAFPVRTGSHAYNGKNYFFSKGQCQLCASAKRNSDGKVSADSEKPNLHCETIDFTKYQ